MNKYNNFIYKIASKNNQIFMICISVYTGVYYKITQELVGLVTELVGCGYSLFSGTSNKAESKAYRIEEKKGAESEVENI